MGREKRGGENNLLGRQGNLARRNIDDSWTESIHIFFNQIYSHTTPPIKHHINLRHQLKHAGTENQYIISVLSASKIINIM